MISALDCVGLSSAEERKKFESRIKKLTRSESPNDSLGEASFDIAEHDPELIFRKEHIRSVFEARNRRKRDGPLQKLIQKLYPKTNDAGALRVESDTESSDDDEDKPSDIVWPGEKRKGCSSISQPGLKRPQYDTTGEVAAETQNTTENSENEADEVAVDTHDSVENSESEAREVTAETQDSFESSESDVSQHLQHLNFPHRCNCCLERFATRGDIFKHLKEGSRKARAYAWY
ncbi:hypothetical protein BKA64DRAFT_778800 [Cadophora sp. MPI-SDFR-AT-0126]|nr:hypothetical protein BKA64DRAFT_778800 [Leotiomycetes sp. MPI-SDFR-AT-0126]